MNAAALGSTCRGCSRACLRASFSLALAGLAFACSTCLAQGSMQRPQSTHAGAGPQAKATSSAHTPVSYDQMVQRAKALVSSYSQDALLLCKQAIQNDPSRYEAHVIAAAALGKLNQYRQALVHLQTALGLAPPDETPRILIAVAETKAAANPDARRQLDVLRSILIDADRAQTPGERSKFLNEFLVRSDPFVKDYPDYAQIWLIRGAIIPELYSGLGDGLGREAAFQVMRLGLDRNEDEPTRRLIVAMDRRGWIFDMTLKPGPQVTAFNNILNSLGKIEGTFHSIATAYHISESDRFSYAYGELRGECSTGFYLDSNIAEEATTSPIGSSDSALVRTEADVRTGTSRFDISNPRFAAYVRPSVPGGPGEDLFLVQQEPRPAALNLRTHSVVTKAGVSKVEDSESNDILHTVYFSVGIYVRQPSDANSLAELLNKLHWACLLRLNPYSSHSAAN